MKIMGKKNIIFICIDGVRLDKIRNSLDIFFNQVGVNLSRF